jgi:tetratricopeptide (TPR) repeat protein
MRHARWIALVLFGWIAAGAAQEQASAPKVSEEYTKLYEQAVRQFQQNDMTGALTTLDAAEKAQANVAQGYNLRGAILVKIKDFPEATKAFQKALELNPDLTMSIFNLGETEFLAGNYAQAKTRFQSFLQKSGSNDLAEYKVFLCNLLGGNEAEAKKQMEKYEPSPSTPISYFTRAAWAFKKDDKPTAVEYLQSAFAIYPAGQNMLFADPMIELGWITSGDVPDPHAEAVAKAQEEEAGPPPAPAPRPAAVDDMLPSPNKDKNKKK